MGQLIPRASLPLRQAAIANARPFTVSAAQRASDGSEKPKGGDAPLRRNPLIGNYRPARPAVTSSRDESVSTERPGATKLPSPGRAPVSSAEVAPNADLPPRPPPAAANSSPFAPFLGGAAGGAAAQPGAGPNAAGRPRYNANQQSTSPINIDILNLINSRSNALANEISTPDPLEQTRVRTKPVTGRTVHVTGYGSQTTGASAPGAISVLEGLVRRQKIKSKFNYQKFHERRGLKKKRLRSERWRNRFRTGFKATVMRVLELKRQGW